MIPSETNILVVDDSEADRELLLAFLSVDGYRTEVARNGTDAIARLEADPESVDVVLLDRIMPGMEGVDVLRRLKKNARLATLPVILQTGAADREDVLEGIRAGAFYYLTKPYDSEMLLSIVRAAAEDHERYRQLQDDVEVGLTGLKLLREARFTLRTIEEARDLGAIMAEASPDPERTVVGLTELLINAIEHGNLGITYDEKTNLASEGGWSAEIARRLALPENADKQVEVRFERTDDYIRFIICDRGSGFDWKKYMEVDPRRAFDTHGRGIAMANLFSFDALEYRGTGSEAVGTVLLQP